MKIQVDDLSGSDVQALLAEHLQGMADHSPPEGIHALDLETGSGEAFEPAHRLYRKHGFKYRGPSAGYKRDSFSRFMSLEIRPVP